MPETSRASARRRAALPGETRTGRRVGAILVLYLIVVATIVTFTSMSIAHERGAAVAVNVASSQRALAERYVRDVILVSKDIPAGPAWTAEQLRANADALLFGGEVVAIRGVHEDVVIDPASEVPRIVAKLQQERRLIEEMIATGEALLLLGRDDPAFADTLLDLRVAGALVTSVSNDAVGALTEETEAAFARLVAMAAALGVLGAVCAIGMGLAMRRAGVRRSSAFRSVVSNASDLITVIDPAGAIVYQSPSSQAVVGIPADALIARRLEDLVHPEDREHFHALIASAIGGAGMTGGFRLVHADGTSRDVEASVRDLTRDRAVSGILLIARDVTDRRRLEEELQRQAFTDSLTGLANRAVFRDRLQHATIRSERNRTLLAVLLLDLDGFKVVNDSLGHDAGDDLLVDVADRIHATCRASDTVARFGGDEFAILLEDDVTEAAAIALAQRLEASLAAPFCVGGRELFVGASVGIAIDAGGTIPPEDMVRNADTAMYSAKASGKGRHAVFRPAMHERTVEFFELHAGLQQALVRGEFLLHYQPIVDLATGRIRAAEALVRWHHPSRGLIAPGEFIPVAEDTGLIVPLGVWILGEACRRAAAWRAQLPAAADLKVNVNLSTRQLLEPDLVTLVAEVLDESTLEPSALTLEVTEGSLMQDVDQTAQKLHALKDLGVRLALDDFGTGSSSLGHLRRFPIDVLKIDKSFVDGVADAESDGAALVRAITELARSLRLGTVAEGIESAEQVDALRASCERGQGYFFARPLAATDLEDVLRRTTTLPPGDGTRPQHPAEPADA